MDLKFFAMMIGQSGSANLVAKGSGVIGESAANGPQTSVGQFVCVPSGGTPPYTYRWHKIQGNANMSVLTTASAATRIQSNENDDVAFGQFRCTVTDAVNTSADTSALDATIFHGSPF